MYAIVGATGNTGRVIADRLLSQGKAVRVIARHEEKLQPLVAKGAQPFAGSALDAVFLARAFEGATAVYTLTPYHPRAEDFRAYQNQVGESVAQAVGRTGVRHVVHLSSLGADLAEGTGPILGLHDQEQRLNRLPGVSVLHLRPTYFMENLLGMIPGIKEMGVLGSPLRPDVAFPMIATRDIANHAAERLLALDFAGHEAQELLGPRDVTMAEVAPVLGKAIGQPELKYVQFPYDEVEKAMTAMMGLSPDLARRMIELNRSINEGQGITATPRTPRNTTETAIEQFAPVFASIYRQA
jgi:uncharacterized protein YbjT (DUF2867 family)